MLGENTLRWRKLPTLNNYSLRDFTQCGPADHENGRRAFHLHSTCGHYYFLKGRDSRLMKFIS